MRRLTIITALCATTAAALSLGGCFSGAPLPAGPVAPDSAVVTASATSNVFSPTTVAVARGGTVTWTIGARPHNVTFVSATGAPANAPTATNTQVSRAFPTTGTFAYACTLHAGMIATIIVQ